MDVDFLYAGDLELFFTFKGFPVGISDIYLKGMVRIILKPLLQEIPVFGGIQIYCLEAPEIEYHMSGIANCLELPGLEQIFEKAINEKVCPKSCWFICYSCSGQKFNRVSQQDLPASC